MLSAGDLAKRLVQFVSVGSVSTGLQFLILIIGVELLGAGAVLSSSFGYCMSAVLNYSLNYKWTFGSSRPHRIAFPRFVMTSLVGLLLNVVVMRFLVVSVSVPYLWAQVVATALVLTWNFSWSALWTFSDHAGRPREK